MEITYENLCARIDKIHSDFYKLEEIRIAKQPRSRNGRSASVRSIEDALPGYTRLRSVRDECQHLIGYNKPFKLYDTLEIQLLIQI